MKYASSLRYAGMLVNACDCDYNSYKKLGLLCPACKFPVFLVGEVRRESHTRKLKDRIVEVSESIVPTHFSHFKDAKSDAEIETCEFRVRSFSSSEFERRKVAAKNQRFKLFQGHFWKLLGMSHKMQGVDQDVSFAEHGYIGNAPVNLSENYKVLKLEKFVDKFIQLFRASKKGIFAAIDDQIIDLVTLPREQLDSLAQGNESLKSYLQSFQSNLESEMHNLIVKEAAEFLLNKRNQEMVRALFLKSFSDFVIFSSIDKSSREVTESDNSHYFFRTAQSNFDENMVVRLTHYNAVFASSHEWSTQLIQKFFTWCLSNISAILVTTPWADGFQRLENWQDDYETKLLFTNNAKGIWHYTVNTDYLQFQPYTQNPQAAIEAIAPIIKDLAPGQQISFAIPGREDFYCRLTMDAGAAMFHLSKGEIKDGLIATCCVAWEPEMAEVGWNLLNQTYEKVNKTLSHIPSYTSKEPKKPEQLPWLSVVVIPNEKILGETLSQTLTWMGHFEACLAQLLVGKN